MPIEADDYDSIAYPSFAYPDTHPNCLAVMGALHGMQPQPVERCRVLEIGCNEGANLIPMAYAIPGSEFVGFDLADVPVKRAQQRIEELGLSNIQVFQGDIMDVDDKLGQFDYIIAHGIYAWVPEPVRDGLLSLCSKHLNPNGIVFVSYNALPGGHLRNMIGDVLRDRAVDGADAMQNVSHGIEFLQYIAELRGKDDPLGSVLKKETKLLQQRSLQGIYHDELSQEQHPVLFTTFVNHAATKGLQYLCEAVVPPPSDPSHQPKAAAMARQLANGDPIAEDQILDYVRMRGYRETLLCHADIPATSKVRLDVLSKMSLSSEARSAAGAEVDSRIFSLPGDVRMETSDVRSITAMEYLMSCWPQVVPFSQLGEVLAEKGIPCDAELLQLLLSLFSARMIRLHLWNAPLSHGAENWPRASASSRQEAVAQGRVTTLLHSSMALGDPIVRKFLSLLDGTRNREDLLSNLKEEFPQMTEANLVSGIEMSLNLLHRAGVLLEEGFPAGLQKNVAA